MNIYESFISIYRSILNEDDKGTVIILFGRMNPPTKGHENMVEYAASLAKKTKGELRIYTSHSQDKKKNPLFYTDKLKILKKAFPKYKGNIIDSDSRTVFKIIEDELQAYSKIIFVVGGDRQEDFATKMKRYPNVEVVSSGDRVAGVSATDMRNAVKAGDFNTFVSGCPLAISKDKEYAKKVFELVAAGLA